MAAASRQVAGQEQDDDRLGRLPNDILVSILKHLDDLRDAVRCSILSKQWRHLPGMLPIIDLDVWSFLKHYDTFEATVPRRNLGLVRAVESVLSRHRRQRTTIDRLAIHFFLTGDDDPGRIVRAVDAAVTSGDRRISSAGLSMFGEKLDVHCVEGDIMLRHATRLLSLLGAYPAAFACLTDLHLESVRLLDGSDVPRLLRACGKLERLSLINCDSGLRAVLPLEHPRLRELRADFCACEAVHLRWLPRLRRVACGRWMHSESLPPFLFGHVPELAAVEFSNAAAVGYIRDLRLSELVGDAATTIRELVLNFENQRVWIQPEKPVPVMHNLTLASFHNIRKQCDLTWTMLILKSAPHLKTLGVTVSDHVCEGVDPDVARQFFSEKDNIQWQPSDFKHRSLSMLVIEGYEVQDKFMKYIKRVMEVAVNLQDVRLRRNECKGCNFYQTGFPQTSKEKDSTRRQINDGRSAAIKVTF
uniref:Uncharacterized protein n=1 Tax=Avena sativa TaxID=4498 RepID=A0ACD5UCP9_AVESA